MQLWPTLFGPAVAHLDAEVGRSTRRTSRVSPRELRGGAFRREESTWWPVPRTSPAVARLQQKLFLRQLLRTICSLEVALKTVNIGAWIRSDGARPPPPSSLGAPGCCKARRLDLARTEAEEGAGHAAGAGRSSCILAGTPGTSSPHFSSSHMVQSKIGPGGRRPKDIAAIWKMRFGYNLSRDANHGT